MSANHYINLLAQAEKLHRHNRQGSFKTRQRYYEAYKRFLRYVGDIWRLEKIANLSGKHLFGYIAYMQGKELSASTIKTDLAAIRFWHDQIPNAKHALPGNDEFELGRRSFGGLDRTWSQAEFGKMIAQCWKANRADFEACIVIARYAGLRIHEVMRIDTAIARAALKDGYFTIKGKGGKIREVPIQETIRVVLKNALEVTPTGRKLFVPDGKKTHIAIAELQNFIYKCRKLVQDEGSTRPMVFHGLRHTCAADWYQTLIGEGKSDNEANLQVSKWFGHERAEITRIYLASVLEDKRR